MPRRHQAQNEEDLFSPQSLFNHQESWARPNNMSRHQKFVFFWQKTMVYSLMLVLAFFASKQNIWIGLVWGTVTSCYPILEHVNAHRAINHHTRKAFHIIYSKKALCWIKKFCFLSASQTNVSFSAIVILHRSRKICITYLPCSVEQIGFFFGLDIVRIICWTSRLN